MIRRTIRRTIVFLLLYAITALSNSNVYADTSREYQLKAAYLLNFARFIYWPEDVFKISAQKFNICVFGSNPFASNLERLAHKKIQSKPVHVHHVRESSAVSKCHVLYISASEEKSYQKVLLGVPKNILTVSDIDGFTMSGGMIEFVQIKNKIKFQINIEKSSDSGIKYRSQLLEVAEDIR